MSNFENRPNTALLVIDVQNAVVADAHDRDSIVANINSLVDRARQHNAPVIWVQHADEQLKSGSDEWQIVPELTPDPAESFVEKQYGDAFEATALAELLADLAVGHVVVAGAQTDACVRATLHGAFVRGYDTTLARDAHTTMDLREWGAPAPDQVISHTNLYWSFQSAPGRTAQSVVTDEVDFSA